MSQSDWPEEGRRAEPPGGRRGDDWDQPPAAPSGMSGGMKACIVIIIVVGVCCLLCCGIFGWLGYSMVPKMSENPADVDAARDEIAKMTLPPGFVPKTSGKSDNFAFTVIFAFYENPGHAALLIGEFSSKMGNDAQMRQQLQMQRNIHFEPMQNEKSETRPIKIKGHDYKFVFATGEGHEGVGFEGRGPRGKGAPGVDKKPGKKIIRHRIEGEFEGNHGLALIVIDFDDTYKEADIVKMLENIQ